MAGNPDNIIIGAATVSIDSSDIGYTRGGCSVTYVPSFVDVIADQAVGIVKKGRTEEKMTVKTSCLEVTLQRMLEAYGQPASNLSGSTLTLGYNNSCSLTERSVVIVGMAPQCKTRTFTLGRCIAIGQRDYQMTRENPTSFDIEFEVLKDSTGHFGTVIDS